MARQKAGPTLAGRLRQAILDSGRSLNELGKQAGIDHSRLSRFVRSERDLTLDAVAKLCDVLGLELCDKEGASPAGAGQSVAETGAVRNKPAPTTKRPRARPRKGK